MHSTEVRRFPPDAALPDRAARQPLSFRGELGDDLPARCAAIPQLIDATDRCADPFVGGELNLTVVVAVKADGQTQAQLAAPSLIFQAAP